jgi:hypothetical protein
MRRSILLAAAAALVACSPPSNTAEAPAETPPAIETACNTVTPDLSKQVQLQTEPVAAAALPPDLPGGPITPGIYDLDTGYVSGGAPAWTEARAVALEVTESSAGVVFNWAAAPDRPDTARWTATFHEGPPAQLSFTCGRTGNAEIAFGAPANQLQLRVPDPGGTGTQALIFVRRPA